MIYRNNSTNSQTILSPMKLGPKEVLSDEFSDLIFFAIYLKKIRYSQSSH